MATNVPITPETPISIRVTIEGNNRKFKLPLGDLTQQVLPGKLRSLLGIPENQHVVFERYSDSAAGYVTLDSANTHVYKTLYRAAKAKLKLRLRATVTGPHFPPLNQASFASAFPDFAKFGSETTLNNNAISIPASTPQPPPSVESLVQPPPTMPTFVQYPAEQQAEVAPVTQKRMSTRLSRDGFFAELANISRNRELALRMKEPQQAPPTCSWSVFCNACDSPMANQHYHCDICDEGDYDLCENCVKDGVHCPGDSHWLIKRFVSNGQVINSTTEKASPKPKVALEPVSVQPEIPGAFTETVEESVAEEQPEEEEYEPVRTCNCCVRERTENQFVTCIDCDDFDLCISCHEANKHGHHPGHTFKAVAANTLSPLAEFLCAPGRNVKHAALCDGCDKPIFGVRHKCLNCPDWDYCSECVKNAKFVHPMHRFVALYEPISAPGCYPSRHIGIYCDGPLCQNKHDYIEGVRYKCAICHDTDFCANCEAYPHNKHNRTHPLIKLRTSVRNVSVTTLGENKTMGDHLSFAKAARNTAPSNAATQVQTIVDVKPAEATYKPSKEKIQIKDLLAEPIQEKIKVQDLLSSPIEEPKRVGPVDITKLQAQFMRETVPDATVMQPDQRFVQVWTMRNTGSEPWPAGCSVRYTGGDNMLNVEKNAPSTITDIAEATETNVIGRPVEVGEEIAFRVTMKAPLSEGTKISYWRLKSADGQAFGHRLWCHINVVAPAPTSEAEPSSLPQVVSPVYAPATVPTVERNEDVGRPSLQDNFLQTVLQQRVDRRREIERSADVHKRIEKAMALQQSRVQEERATRAQMLRNLSAEIHAVEVQHKAKVAAAKAAIDAANVAKQETDREVLSELPAHGPSNVGGTANHIWLLMERSRRLEEARKAAESQAHEVEAPASPVAVKEEIKQKDAKAESSGMIFPTLDKESPASSIHDVAAPVIPAAVKAESASPSTAESDVDIFEDAESVEFVDSDSEVGFLTDEEYDILDASDEETLA